MLNVLFSCLMVYLSSAFGDPVFREDYNFRQDVNGWIKLHRVPANWHDARFRCRAEGASLASPSNANLRAAMVSAIIAESADPHLGVYSGIHSTFSNGTYTTIEGVSLANIPASWAVGQPDNVYTENCVIFHMNGTLEDVDCSKAFPYICYKKFEALTMNKCNTVDDGYKWDARTGHCYKFHRIGQTWSRAHMTCVAEGGYLGIINSDQEASVFKELFAKYPTSVIFADSKDAAIIGMREWPDERSWFTVHGQTLEEAGYTKWSGSQPDNMLYKGENQHCGAIYRTALFDDILCSQHYAFICEKDPETSLALFNNIV